MIDNQTTPDDLGRIQQPRLLHSGTSTIIPMHDCQLLASVMPSGGKAQGLTTTNNICIMPSPTGAFKGDSGGPLMVQSTGHGGTGPWFQVGVASWVMNQCEASPAFPSESLTECERNECVGR